MSESSRLHDPNSAPLSILFLGAAGGTSRDRANALRRLGHCVMHLDPRQVLWQSRLLNSWIHHSGAFGVHRVVRKRLANQIHTSTFDLVWVDGGLLINPDLVTDLRKRFGRIINYNIDDPFGTRDGLRFRQYLRSVPFYDLLVVVRECNITEAREAGARDVMHVFRSADEVTHAPRELSAEDRDKWGSEVAFIGTWMPERGPFLRRLIELGVPLAIRGNGWREAKEWPALRPHWRGPDLRDGDLYCKAVQCAKVCLGLLSKGNRDLSTTRSFEIPHLGGVFCAERTPEHSLLYKENEEAVFWDTAEECASKCRQLLDDEAWRNRLRKYARIRCLRNETINEPTMRRILQRALTNQRQTMWSANGQAV